MSPDAGSLALPNIDVMTPATSLWSWAWNSYPAFFSFIQDVFGFLVAIALILSVFFIIGIIYCVEQLKRIRNKEEQIYSAKVEPAFEAVHSGDVVMAARWQRAQTHIASTNPNDWKQAVMEADIILDDLLTKLGYRGESIGEKLKRVATGDMKSLNEAWEAHKIRNQIAHESGYVLSERDALNAMNMYKKVFEEFYVI